MNFSEMLIGLGNGKQYRRSTWTVTDGYLSVPMGTKYIYRNVVVNGNLNMSLALFSLEDLHAVDWQEARVEDITPPATPVAPPEPVIPPLAA